MTLVSYDQVANLTDNKASVFYWIIVGAYFIKGNDDSVQTFVDTAVFDLKTHKLLFRAPGVNNFESSSTLVNAEETVRKNRSESFDAAVADMNKNLADELQHFRERIKTEHVAKVNYAVGYGGGGGGGFGLIGSLAFLGLTVSRRR